MEDPFDLTEHIGTVCLPPRGHVPNNPDCIATGWGKDFFGKAGKYSVIMKKIVLPIVPFHQCQAQLQETRLKKVFRLDPSFICAGGEDGRDTCQVHIFYICNIIVYDGCKNNL